MHIHDVPTIKTKRLEIKEISMDNAFEMFEYRSNQSIQKYQSFKPKEIEDVRLFIKNNTTAFNTENTWHQLGIFLENKLIGDLGIHFIGPNNMQCEIGYTISTNYQRQGFGKEAVAGLVSYLFNNLQKHRIIASLDPNNTSSQLLLESISFRKEGLFKESVFIENRWDDDLIYAITENEWAGRNQYTD